MLPLAFLTHWSENAHFTLEFRVFNDWRQFSFEEGHFLTNGSKKFLSTLEAMVNFLGLKNHIFP